MKTITHIILLAIIPSHSIWAACIHESCSDSIKFLDEDTHRAIAEELANTNHYEICKALHEGHTLITHYLYRSHCSAEYIHEVYTHFADALTPEQAKYLFSRSPEASKLIGELILGLEYARKELQETDSFHPALEHILTALNKSKVTHCPHCYAKIIIPAIDQALELLEEEGCNAGAI